MIHLCSTGTTWREGANVHTGYVTGLQGIHLKVAKAQA